MNQRRLWRPPGMVGRVGNVGMIPGGSAAAAQISAVVYDGVGDYLKHTGGPGGAADGADLTLVWAGTLNSDGSTMMLVDIPGTVPVQLIRQSDNTIDFIGGTAGAVFSNSTAAVAAALGFLIVIAHCSGTSSTLTVIHAAGTITGTNTPGAASNLDLTADWYFGSDGGATSFLDADTAMWWADNTVVSTTEQFWDSTNDTLRDPGSDGSNPLDGDHAPLVCHVNPAATHTVNRGSGGDADVGTTFEDGTSPGAYAADYVVPLTLTLTAGASNTINQASSTFSAQAIGDPDSTRVIFVAIAAYANLAVPGAVPTVTLGGDSMTEIVSEMGSSGNARARTHIYAIAQSAMSSPTDTTADIVVTYGASHFGKRIEVYRMTGGAATATDTGTHTNTDPLSATITFPSGGAVVAIAMNGGDNTDGYAWTNLTEDADVALGGGANHRVSSASDSLVTGGATAVTADPTSAGAFTSLVVASFAES